MLKTETHSTSQPLGEAEQSRCVPRQGSAAMAGPEQEDWGSSLAHGVKSPTGAYTPGGSLVQDVTARVG